MNRVAGGDLDALVPLYDKYQQRLYNYFLRLTGDRHISADLTQNVFSRVISYRKSWKKENVFASWLFAMGRNIFYDHCRKNRIFSHSQSDELEERDDLLGSTEGDDRKERHQLVREALQKLPPEYREVLELSRFQEMSYREIAVLTETTEGAVKVKAHRAIRKLKEVYFDLIKN